MELPKAPDSGFPEEIICHSQGDGLMCMVGAGAPGTDGYITAPPYKFICAQMLEIKAGRKDIYFNGISVYCDVFKSFPWHLMTHAFAF